MKDRMTMIADEIDRLERERDEWRRKYYALRAQERLIRGQDEWKQKYLNLRKSIQEKIREMENEE